MDEWQRSGRLSWLSDLAEIPEKYGVTNVYGDLGAIFAWTVIAQPVLAAAMMGTLIKGLGADHVIWGTDSVWTGSPQWQIEAMRRLEIPDDMQKQYRFAPLGPADGPVKNAILGENGLRKAELGRPDRFTAMKEAYEQGGPSRSNLRYGYMHKPARPQTAMSGQRGNDACRGQTRAAVDQHDRPSSDARRRAPEIL